jgi:hypothetical protein
VKFKGDVSEPGSGSDAREVASTGMLTELASATGAGAPPVQHGT